MATITRENFRDEIRKITSVLPRNTRQEIVNETGETYPVVQNVWQGITYNERVINAIVKRYNQIAKTIKPVKVA